jgi:CMP-N,N'-diacetyllegionaminic acid synthase|tara:strand:+ start:153 stop:884 length:732 start_codon:yes stop_codon:yes gene_type:complete
MSIVGLIPARQGSERVKNKNVRPLNGVPLLAYSIASALESDIFDAGVFVSTDSEEYAVIARQYGAKVIMRKGDEATSVSPDIAWITSALHTWVDRSRPDEFAILRPTSPFRSADTIRRAYKAWTSQKLMFDSLRAVKPVSSHPAKMWRQSASGYLEPLLLQPSDPPWHSSQLASLPVVYEQTASLEIAHTKTAMNGSIAGERIMPFLHPWPGSQDINTELDFIVAELLAERGEATLPKVTKYA